MGGYTYDLTDEELSYLDTPPPADPGVGTAPAPAPVQEAAPPPENAYSGYDLSNESLAYQDTPPQDAAAPPPQSDPGYLGGYSPAVPDQEAAPPPPEQPKAPPPEQPSGPNIFERAATGLTELPGNAVDAIGGLFQSDDPRPQQTTAARDAGRDAVEIQRQRQQAEERGARIDRDVLGPGEFVSEKAGQFADWAGDFVEDPGGSLEAAGTAIKDSGLAQGITTWGGDVIEDPGGTFEATLDASKNSGYDTFNRGLDYSKNIVSQDQAAILLKELTTGETLDETSPGNIYYLEGPMRLHALNNPEDAQRMVDAYYQGYTREDGTFIEPGDRAMYIAYYEPLDTGQKMKHDAYYDPALIPMSVATMGVGGVANAAARIPKVGKVAAPALKYGVEALDTATSLGTNLAVPGLIKGVKGAGEATGLLRPSQRTLDNRAVEGVVEETANYLNARNMPEFDAEEVLRPSGTDIPWNMRDEKPLTTYRTADEVELRQIDAQGRGAQTLTADYVRPDGTVLPAGSRRLEFAVGRQNRFVVQQGVGDGQAWFVRENLPDAPGFSFVRPGTPLANGPVGANFTRFIVDDPETEAIKFAKNKTMEWQRKGSPDPVTFTRPAVGTPAMPGPAVPVGARRNASYYRQRPYHAIRQVFGNTWEDRAQAQLPQVVKDTLDQTVTYKNTQRRVGDLVHEFESEIDDLRRAARGEAVSRTPAQMGVLERRWNSQQGAVVDWARMSNAEADDLIAFRTGMAMQESITKARGKPANDIFAKGLGVVDSYLAYRRAMQLYGWPGGVQYITMQGVGNAITGAIAKPAALPAYFSNLANLRKIMKWDKANGTVPVEQLPSFIRMQRANGLMGNANAKSTFQSAIGIGDGGPFNHPGASGFKKAIGKFLAPRAIADVANAMDLSWRMALGGHTYSRGIRQVNKNLADAAVATRNNNPAWAGLTITDDQVRAAIKAVMDKHGDEFNASHLREAIWQAGGGLNAARQSGELRNFADRVARDWTEQARGVQKAAKDEINRAAFSFENTNLDEVLQRTFMFHYWMSRASVLYLREAAQNPWQLRAWMQGMEEAERQQDATGVTGWKKTFVEFMKTPAGYAVSLNPVSLLGTWFFFAEQGGERPLNDYTTLGQFFDDGIGGNVMINPLLRAAIYFTGAGGADFTAGDIFGTRKWERKVSDALNLANQLGDGFIRSQGGVPVYMDPIDSRNLFSWIAQYTSGKLPGSRETDPFSSISFQRQSMIWLISDRLVENDPDLRARLESTDPTVAQDAADQLEMATEEILLNPKNPLYQQALDDLVDAPYLGPLSDKGPLGKIAGGLIREASPFAISESIIEQNDARYRKKVADSPTLADKEREELLYKTGDTRALNLAFEKAGANGWTGDFGVEALLKAQNPSASTEEILMMAAQVRRDPKSPLAQEAQRLEDAEGVVRQITSGNWAQGDLVVGDQRISQERLNLLGTGDRWKWAEAWLGTQGLAEAHQQWRTVKEEFVQSEPVLQGWYGYKDLAENYPGGTALWIEDTMKVNPGFRKSVEGIMEQKGLLPGSDALSEAVISSGVYLAAEGAPQFGKRSTGNGQYAGLANGQSLASYNAQKQAEKKAEQSGGGDEAAAILKDMSGVNTAFAIASRFGEGETFLNRLATGDTKTYYLNSYNAIKDELGYVPAGRDSRVEEYVVWLQQQPAGIYATEEDAVAAFVNQRDFDPSQTGELPQESGGGGTGGGTSLFDMYQRGDVATPDPVAAAGPEVNLAPDALATLPVVTVANQEYAYLRAGPGQDTQSIAVLRMGQGGRLVRTETDAAGMTWGLVVLPDGRTGYVYAPYLLY